ncbi:TetR/AcrR family transcriptional regulator [Mycolicibacterium iranicum]|uniref:TetR family transcriptional regulator n=1 Tax=Mycolicibacterium iranicum TaxID=912594 RepID=A0A178M2Z0_MYCIR|nr:TetR/AcrR family transcriptional regulator [Mycolicibacterium iranicum]OAN41826.1 TetR family transcriptional regulator [Mycolicibacterium iranicum]
MARLASDRKAETRRRIIAAAGGRLKTDGIDGSGVATLMSDAGLTNGAFYAHFTSKDDLVANVVADQLRGQQAVLTALPPGRAALDDFLREYLSAQHRDNPGAGCPNAALLDEIGRCSEAVRTAYTQGMEAIVGVIAAHLSPSPPEVARSTALGLFTILVASMQLARAVSDPALSDDILAAGIRNATALLDQAARTPPEGPL